MPSICFLWDLCTWETGCKLGITPQISKLTTYCTFKLWCASDIYILQLKYYITTHHALCGCASAMTVTQFGSWFLHTVKGIRNLLQRYTQLLHTCSIGSMQVSPNSSMSISVFHQNCKPLLCSTVCGVKVRQIDLHTPT